MELMVQRFNTQKDWTAGALFDMTAGPPAFLAYTLEDEQREVKVHSETRIPFGRYQIKLRTSGGHHTRYARKFPGIHKGMLWLRSKDGKGEVPGFKWILIHIGNTEKDTAGCLLVGLGCTPGRLSNSTTAYKKVYKHVVKALSAGEKVFITYWNWDEGKAL